MDEREGVEVRGTVKKQHQSFTLFSTPLPPTLNSTHVTLDDLAAFLTDPAAAKEAMTMLDMDGDGR